MLAGRYRLDRMLGKGAMGQVWAAHDTALGRWVAIKQVTFPTGTPAAEAEQAGQRAMREARAIASVSDPNVVTVFDLLVVDGNPAIVMELLDARSLAEILAEHGAMSDHQAAVIGLGVASALLAAHAAGVTHRDVKPGNVLICRDGRIKLTDFGIARTLGENTLTATGILLGSPAYIAPEVAGGHPAAAAADAWGLGAMLYACVEGAPPFDAGTPLKTLAAVVQDPAPQPARSGTLTELINALLIKDPKRRMPVSYAHHLLVALAGDPRGHRLATHGWHAITSRPATRAKPAGPAPTEVRGPARPAELPPPPWAGRSETLHALPTGAAAPPPRPRWVWPVTVLIGIAAAVGGYFGVRALAMLDDTAPQGAPASMSHPMAADSGALPPGAGDPLVADHGRRIARVIP